MEMTVYGAPADRASLEALADAGVDRAVLAVPVERSDALAALDDLAEVSELVA